MTLPSYTVLPMRATTPPMIDGSTFVASVTVRPVSCASPRSIACARSAAERHRRRDFGPHDLLMIQQPLAIRREQVRQQHQPIALGEQRDAASPGSATVSRRAVSSATAACLRWHGNGRIQQHLLERRMLREQIDERRQVLLDLLADRRFSLMATSRRARA